MILLAVDPGSTESALVVFDLRRSILVTFEKLPNEEVKRQLATWVTGAGDHLVIEMIASYGMPVGAEVFDTCVWIGRFIEAWGRPHALMFRREVKLHLCGQARAKDGNVRQAVLDRYGGKERAVGRKSAQGPLYGVKADCWQALALAITYSDAMGTTVVSGGAT